MYNEKENSFNNKSCYNNSYCMGFYLADEPWYLPRALTVEINEHAENKILYF
jgi:hypothetical protein